METASNKETAVLGGGCFWCTEAVFKMLKGISSVMPGYAAGLKADPTYEEVSGGGTGHAEAVKIEFDPALISFKDILTVFFGSHDPTTKDRQGSDVGSQYRSVIFYATPAQKTVAEDFIKGLNASSKEGAKIVTAVEPFRNFYEAESYHRDYYENNKDARYCEVIINPKLEKVQKDFARLLKEEELKKKLTPEQYRVLRQKGTEAPFTGKYVHEDKDGTYRCAVCGNALFESGAKFESGTGWPSFDEAIAGSVEYARDAGHGMDRTEVLCARCGSHLGHVFDDGPTKTGKRYCVNSVCMDLLESP